MTVVKKQELTVVAVEDIINNHNRNEGTGLIDNYPSMRMTSGVAELAGLKDTSWLMDILYDAFEVCSEVEPHIEVALEVYEDNSAKVVVTDGKDGVFTELCDTFNNCSFPLSITFAIDFGEDKYGKVSIM